MKLIKILNLGRNGQKKISTSPFFAKTGQSNTEIKIKTA
jgi:hypothetical protein